MYHQGKSYEILGVMVSLIMNGRGKDTYKPLGINWIDPEIKDIT